MNRVRRVVVAVAVGAALSGIAQAAPQTQSQPPTAPPPTTQPPATAATSAGRTADDSSAEA